MRSRLALGGLALALVALLGWGLEEMALYGHQGWSLARRGVAARNYVRHGLVATRLAPVESPAGTDPDEFVWYPNHPALTSLLCGAARAAFGEGEWALRIVPIAFTLAGFLLLTMLARSARGPGFALLVGVLVLAMPVWTYYGAFVNHEPIVTFATIALVSSLVALDRGWRAGGLCAGGAALLGALDDWSFLFVAGPLAVWALVHARRRGRARQALWVVVPVAIAATVTALHALSLPGESLALFGERIWQRSTLQVSFLEVITNPLVIPRFPMLFGPIAAAAALGWPIVAAVRSARGRTDLIDGAMLAIWVGAVLYCVVPADRLRNHDYWFFLFGPLAPWALATVLADQHPRVRVLLGALVVVASLGFGMAALHDLRRLPTELVEEWPGFRLEQNMLMRHLRRRSSARDTILFEETIDLPYQARYYLDRRFGWFRGQQGLADFALQQRAALVVLPAANVDGVALAELGSRFRLSAFGSSWIVDLRRGPGAVEVSRLVHERASTAWRYRRSLAYEPTRVVRDGARAAELTRALWATLEGPAPPTREDWADRGDLEARLARQNRGEAAGLAGALPISIGTQGSIAEVLGARLEPRADGGLDVWVVVRAHAPVPLLALPTVWISDMPERASDWTLWPRVPEAWWVPGGTYALHRTIGLTRGRHDVWLRMQLESDALGLDRDRELGTVDSRDRLPWLGRY